MAPTPTQLSTPSTKTKKPYTRFVPTKRFMHVDDFEATSKELEEMKTTNNTRQFYISTEIIRQFPEKGTYVQTPEESELINKYVQLKKYYQTLAEQDAKAKEVPKKTLTELRTIWQQKASEGKSLASDLLITGLYIWERALRGDYATVTYNPNTEELTVESFLKAHTELGATWKIGDEIKPYIDQLDFVKSKKTKRTASFSDYVTYATKRIFGISFGINMLRRIDEIHHADLPIAERMEHAKQNNHSMSVVAAYYSTPTENKEVPVVEIQIEPVEPVVPTKTMVSETVTIDYLHRIKTTVIVYTEPIPCECDELHV